MFVVVTREARDTSGEVHDRLPGFLEEDLWDKWLSPEPLTVQGRPEESARHRAALLKQLER